MTRSAFLINKFCPELFTILCFANIDWELLDTGFENKLRIDGTQRQNLIGLLFKASQGGRFSIQFANFVNQLILETKDLLGNRKKYHDIFIGKSTNLNDWNFLNPIGEVAILSKLDRSGYTIRDIENNTRYPNLSSKDFLFETPEGGEVLIEVLNIHPKEQKLDFDSLRNELILKVKRKVSKEVKSGFKPLNGCPLVFQPIIWTTNLDSYRHDDGFFENFTKTFGGDFGFTVPVMGFCALGKDGSGSFVFGEISSLFN